MDSIYYIKIINQVLMFRNWKRWQIIRFFKNSNNLFCGIVEKNPEMKEHR